LVVVMDTLCMTGQEANTWWAGLLNGPKHF
jgi:hypothetical protein